MRARFIAVGKSGWDEVSWEALAGIQAGTGDWQFTRWFQMWYLILSL